MDEEYYIDLYWVICIGATSVYHVPDAVGEKIEAWLTGSSLSYFSGNSVDGERFLILRAHVTDIYRTTRETREFHRERARRLETETPKEPWE